jgi:hypothetical protein
LYLAAGLLAALGLLAFWPALIMVPFVSFGAYRQRAGEKKAATAARYAHTRRTP